MAPRKDNRGPHMLPTTVNGGRNLRHIKLRDAGPTPKSCEGDRHNKVIYFNVKQRTARNDRINQINRCNEVRNASDNIPNARKST